jgi:hypothetical protein
MYHSEQYEGWIRKTSSDARCKRYVTTAMGANLALVRWEKKLAAAVVQLDGSVLTWHMTDWLSTACCLLFIWGAFKK